MSAAVTIELDTTAPQATIGQPARSGTEFIVPYTVDEPGVVSAELVGEGPMIVEPTRFRIVTQSQQGIVSVLTRDDVGNEREQSFIVGLEPPPTMIGDLIADIDKVYCVTDSISRLSKAEVDDKQATVRVVNIVTKTDLKPHEE